MVQSGGEHRRDVLTRYSLVLGAGGRSGLAYHAGTLLALELHGLCPSGAVSITGTSAGSIATAFFAVGGTVEDLAAYTAAATPRAAFADVAASIALADARRARLDVGALWYLLDPRRAIAAAAHVRARRFGSAIATIAPGLVQIRHRFAFLDATAGSMAGVQWAIVAAELSGRRHVFRSGDAPLSLAVAASCAVPGLFSPVHHGGRRLVDGGVHSTTNADLAADDTSDAVIVLAPMCPRGGDPTRIPAERSLDAEVARLEAAGKRIVVFRPSVELRRRMGRNPLAGGRSREITRDAFLEAADLIGELGPRRRRDVTDEPV